jgi:hypothetical protein
MGLNSWVTRWSLHGLWLLLSLDLLSQTAFAETAPQTIAQAQQQIRTPSQIPAKPLVDPTPPPSAQGTQDAAQAAATHTHIAATNAQAADSRRPDAEGIRDILTGIGLLIGFIAVAAIALAVLLLIRALVDAIQKQGDSVGMYSNWGGFGGGLAGWSMSRSLSLLISAVLMGGLTLALAAALSSAVLAMKHPAKTTAESPTATSGSNAPSQSDEHRKAAPEATGEPGPDKH